jgi:hypothetical protein
MERVREKEEKEAKRRKRLADDFFRVLSSIKVQQAVCQLFNFFPSLIPFFLYSLYLGRREIFGYQSDSLFVTGDNSIF